MVRGSLGALGSVLAGLGLAGAILAIASTFAVIIKIQVLTVTPATFTGYDRTGPACVLLGAFGLLMVVGAARGARPAMGALALVGLAVLLIAVLHELPHLHDTGVWPLHDSYEDAQAAGGPGYLMELAGGILMIFSGLSLLLFAPRRVAEAPTRRERPPVAPAAPQAPVDEYAPRHRRRKP